MEYKWFRNYYTLSKARDKGNIVLVYPDKALAYVHGVIINIIDGVIASSPGKQLESFEG